MNLISLFNLIRDIPYRIPLKWGEQDDCCNGKHRRLLKTLAEEGYKVRYVVCVFLWSDLNLPDELKEIPHENDCTHVYLDIFLNNSWVTLDATWDKCLKKVFAVNEWDGKSDTTIAVKPIQTFSPEKSARIMTNQNEESINKDLEKNSKFYEAFNNWLVEIRNK